MTAFGIDLDELEWDEGHEHLFQVKLDVTVGVTRRRRPDDAKLAKMLVNRVLWYIEHELGVDDLISDYPAPPVFDYVDSVKL